MCWISTEVNCLNSGDRKIPILKVLRRPYDQELLEAYHRGTPYVLNKEYVETINVEHNWFYKYYKINTGLHCYGGDCKFVKCHGGIYIHTPNSNCMFYSDITSTLPYKVAVVEGYIPPNTEYYLNKDNEIVTSKLVLTKILSIT